DAAHTTVAAVDTPYAGATLYFVPAAQFNGDAGFTYTVTDNDNNTDGSPATGTITVTLSGSDVDGTIASYTLKTLPTAGQGVLYTDAAHTTVAAVDTPYAGA